MRRDVTAAQGAQQIAEHRGTGADAHHAATPVFGAGDDDDTEQRRQDAGDEAPVEQTQYKELANAADQSLEEEEQRESGVSEDEAHYAALRAFGNPTLIREQTLAVWTWNWLESLGRDVSHSTSRRLSSNVDRRSVIRFRPKQSP